MTTKYFYEFMSALEATADERKIGIAFSVPVNVLFKQVPSDTPRPELSVIPILPTKVFFTYDE